MKQDAKRAFGHLDIVPTLNVLVSERKFIYSAQGYPLFGCFENKTFPCKDENKKSLWQAVWRKSTSVTSWQIRSGDMTPLELTWWRHLWSSNDVTVGKASDSYDITGRYIVELWRHFSSRVRPWWRHSFSTALRWPIGCQLPSPQR